MRYYLCVVFCAFSLWCLRGGNSLMPVQKTKDGGYRWGTTGKVYYGKDARRKAEAQGRAIEATGWTEKKRKK